MAQTVSILPNTLDTQRLKQTVGDRNRRLKQGRRAKMQESQIFQSAG
jgi:hypothetical protein